MALLPRRRPPRLRSQTSTLCSQALPDTLRYRCHIASASDSRPGGGRGAAASNYLHAATWHSIFATQAARPLRLLQHQRCGGRSCYKGVMYTHHISAPRHPPPLLCRAPFRSPSPPPRACIRLSWFSNQVGQEEGDPGWSSGYAGRQGTQHNTGGCKAVTRTSRAPDASGSCAAARRAMPLPQERKWACPRTLTQSACPMTRGDAPS